MGNQFEQEMYKLLLQLESGLPSDMLDLLLLPIALHRGDHLALRSAGIMTDQLGQLTSQQLDDVLGPVVSKQLDALRPRGTDQLVPRRRLPLRQETMGVAEPTPRNLTDVP